MSNVARDLPAEFNPDSWPIGDRTASCMQQVPINKAYQDLDDCYRNGADLTSCRSKVDYDTVYTSYQQCIAGTDLTSTNIPSTTSSSDATASSLVSYAQAVAQPATVVNASTTPILTLSSTGTKTSSNVSSANITTPSASNLTATLESQPNMTPNVKTVQSANKTYLWIMIVLQSVNLLVCIAIILLAYFSSSNK